MSSNIHKSKKEPVTASIGAPFDMLACRPLADVVDAVDKSSAIMMTSAASWFSLLVDRMRKEEMFDGRMNQSWATNYLCHSAVQNRPHTHTHRHR